MTVTEKAIAEVSAHWAVHAVSQERRDMAFELAKTRMVQGAIGDQLHIPYTPTAEDDELLSRVATAYEIASVDGIDALLHPSSSGQSNGLASLAQAGAYQAFELLRAVEVPEPGPEQILFVLHLCALGYVGERWTEVRRWLNEHPSHEGTQGEPGGWDQRILSGLYQCWFGLFRKHGWEDLTLVGETIRALRAEQSIYEEGLLNQGDPATRFSSALRLVSLYHLARATEVVAAYMMQGGPPGITASVDQHMEAAEGAARESGDVVLEMLLRWLHVAARRMIGGSVWYAAQGVNSRVTEFVRNLANQQALFELLPPQQAALQEQGLLDQASRAVIVDLPTSGGKTLLAEFRVLQALNTFDAEGGWVAYVAPTRALVTQLTRRLRRDLGPVGVAVEQLTPAVDLDSFEEQLLSELSSGAVPFQVLVTTPEKLDLVIRNKKTDRPLALLVMDEAHNIEEEDRGLRIELLLAVIKRDCRSANFLLLMPTVPNASDIAKWLAPESGRTISLGTSVWKPNDRVIGLYSGRPEAGRGNWSLWFETLSTAYRTVELRGTFKVGETRPLSIPYSSAGTLTAQTGAIAKVFSERGTSIAIARRVIDTWSMARQIVEDLPELDPIPEEVALVQRFLASEISPKFELIDMLRHGVAVHNSGLSDEVRTLVELLAENGKLRVLCATTGITQGIDFPVSSVFLASRSLPTMPAREMTTRAFWNLAGRAGRTGQSTLGVVGLAAGSDSARIREFVRTAQIALASRLETMLKDLEARGRLGELTAVIQADEWADFRSYVAHLYNEAKDPEILAAKAEEILRNTFGFTTLQSAPRDTAGQAKAVALLEATKSYAKTLAVHPENARLSDSTGFAPEGVISAITSLNQVARPLTLADWKADSLFGKGGGSVLPQLVGVMMQIPQIRNALGELVTPGHEMRQISDIARDWVGGMSIERIARLYFSRGGSDLTSAITEACRKIYRNLANSTTWGLYALTVMPNSGIPSEELSEDDRRQISNLPAMLFYGVSTEAGILMRSNSVPRSIAMKLGETFWVQTAKAEEGHSVRSARSYLRSLDDRGWQAAVPEGSPATGRDYRAVWSRLAGEPLQPVT